MKNPIFPVSIIFLIGIIVASFLPQNIFYIMFALAVIPCVLTLIFLRNKTLSQVFLFILIFLAGIIRFLDFNEFPKNHIKFIVTEKPKRMVLKGTVSSNPIFKRRFEYLPELEFLLKLEAVNPYPHLVGVSGKLIDVEGLVLVKSYFSGLQTLSYGDTLLVEGIVARPEFNRNNKGFDYSTYLANKKIYAISKIGKEESIKKTGVSNKPLIKIQRFLYAMRNNIRDSILINLESPHSSILITMLLGDRIHLNNFVKDIFIKTGTMHILAISGLHIGIIVFIFLGLFNLVRIPKKLSSFLAIILIFLYALMVGERPSVWRATIMASVFLLGFILNREADILNILSLSLLILLFITPNYIYDSGFILSFACVASIVWISPIVDILFKVKSKKLKVKSSDKKSPPPPEADAPLAQKADPPQAGKVIFYVLKSLSISISVWIGTMPIIAYYFHIISPITIMANLLIIPLSFILIGLGMVGVFLNLFSPSLGIVFYEAVWFVDNIIFLTLNFFSKVPFAFFEIKFFPFFYILTYYALLVVLFSLVRKKIVTFL